MAIREDLYRKHYRVQLLRRALRVDVCLAAITLLAIILWVNHGSAVGLVVEAFLACVFSIVNALYRVSQLHELREQFHIRDPADWKGKEP